MEQAAENMIKDLPLEMVYEVLNQLTDQNDIVNGMMALPGWNRRMQIVVLFAHHPDLAPSPLMALRQLNKTFKQAIDSFWEQSFDPTLLGPFKDDYFLKIIFNPNLLGQLRGSYSFGPVLHKGTVTHRANMFLGRMAAHAGNPFVGKFVRFHFSNTVPGRRTLYFLCFEAATALLERFGQHLRYFTHVIPLRDSRRIVMQVMHDMPALLRLLPNLKILFLDWSINSRLDLGTQRFVQWINNNPLVEHPPTEGGEREQFLITLPMDGFREFLSTLQFPILDRLTTLHLNVDCGEYSVAIGRVLLGNYGAQLTTLICNGELLFDEDEINTSLPKLKHLMIKNVGSLTAQKLIRARLPLQQLILSRDDLILPVDDLVGLFNTYSATLVYLQLDLEVESKVNLELSANSGKLVGTVRQLSIRSNFLQNNLFWEVIPHYCENVYVIDVKPSNFTRDYRDIVQRAFREFPNLKEFRFWQNGSLRPVMFYRPIAKP